MMGKERSLLVTIRIQLSFVGRAEWKVGLEKLVIVGKIKGTRQRGGNRLKYMAELELAASSKAVGILRRVGDRVGFIDQFLTKHSNKKKRKLSCQKSQ